MSLKNDFERDGVVVVRNAIPKETVDVWRFQWDMNHSPERVPEFNPVAVNDAKLHPLLRLISHEPALLDLVEQVFGPDIALYNQRFVVKDKHARGEVFLHQDTGYHVGWPRKLSAFVPLSSVVPDNGAMFFFLGSHRFGYLGDAGEIIPNLLDKDEPVCFMASPGDVILMHSATWHGSYRCLDETDRIMADIIYQPADDPSGIELLRGKWQCEPQPWLRGDLFVRSRTSRLKEMQARIDELEGK